ncbi:MAG: UbiA family prenyltransferase [Desulforhopalus sp.]|nr:UbiA family prenyltransferase [Desulforhopalus sp.]
MACQGGGLIRGLYCTAVASCGWSALIARLRLAKTPLCLLVGVATVFGAILAEPVFSQQMLIVAGGVFLVATGSASLNSLQEHGLDGAMIRTKGRPLPSGKLTRAQAAWQAAVLIALGLLLVVTHSENRLAELMTLAAVLLYNCVYTPLKGKTVLAIVPGALCGALPAYIGWLTHGGDPDGLVAILLVVLFVLWQIPHYWLVLLSYQEDYAAGIVPNFLSQFRENTLERFFVTWLGALVVIMLMFAAFPYSLSSWVRCLIVANALILPGLAYYWLRWRKRRKFRLLFIALNCLLLNHMVILGGGRMLANGLIL